MQSLCIDDSSAIIHHRVNGDAFSFSNRSRLIVCGGVFYTNLIDINEPDKFYRENIPLTQPVKNYVTSYEWDPFHNTKYIQNRNRIIELIDIEDPTDSSRPVGVYVGHSGSINEAKWSPFKTGLLASCANDSYIYLWNTESEKPILKEHSLGGAHCVGWSKKQENILSLASNNDVKIYDLRKLNTVLRYIPNAHSKRISSIDWCSVEDKLLVCGHDKTVRMWSLNSSEEKLNPIKIDDFQCWKARFLPQSTSFIVMPACLSMMLPNKALSLSFSKQLSPTTPTVSSTPHLLTQQSEVQTSCRMVVCQTTSSNQPKIYKYHSNRTDMIVNFDFYFNDDYKSLIAWTKDQSLISFPLDSHYNKDSQSSKVGGADDTTDLPARILTSQQSSTNMKLLQQQTIADASSRKSSFSEYGIYGTPPTVYIGLQSAQLVINSSDETAPYTTNSQYPSLTLTSLQQQQQTRSHAAEIVPYPKCFCAKFSGLPQHLIVFQNKTLNQYKTYPKQYLPQNDKLTERMRHKNKTIIKQSKSRVKITDKRSRVYIIDMSDLLTIRYDLAAKYMIMHPDNRIISEKNFLVALNEQRGDLPQVWDLLKFITTHAESISLNPDHGQPWSCTTFGRPLVNYIIENSMKIFDIQTTVMVITKLLQYDRSLVPIRSSVHRQRHNEVCYTDAYSNIPSSITIFDAPGIQIVKSESEKSTSEASTTNNNDNRSYNSSLTAHHKNIGLLDPDRINEYDFLIKYYCDILYRWGLYIKRAELYEYIHDKPPEFNTKFECPNRCKKCKNKTVSSKCYNTDCKSYNLYCSLCQLPVNGLSITCIMCGHGGHYTHMAEWFKKQDDCAAACGCKCVDYI